MEGISTSGQLSVPARLPGVGRGVRRRRPGHRGAHQTELAGGRRPRALALARKAPTFTVNIVGAFLVGYFTTRLLERLPLSSYRRPLLGTGLCGGLTTFSTMQVETLKMIEHHHYGLAAGYTCASVVFGFLAAYLATALVRRVPVR
jgi:protein CrcB